MNSGGFYSCHICEISGVYCGGAVHFLDINPTRRTYKTFKETVNKCCKLLEINPDKIVSVKGIEGPSVFSKLPFLFIPRYKDLMISLKNFS